MNALGRGAPGRRGGFKLWPVLLFGLYLGYYFLTHQQPANFTGRQQFIDTSAADEAALGFQSFQQILAESDVVRDGELPRQVDAIMRRLVEAAPNVEAWLAQEKGIPASTDWSAFDWEVQVIRSDQVNAFCLPGGKMAVYTGIVPVAANADGLAAIMGHEIAHALLRHGGERMAQQKLVQMGQLAAGLSISEMDPTQQRMVMTAIGAGAQYGFLMPFSRDHESEADAVGQLLAAAACFDPAEGPRLWERMGAASGGKAPPEFLSTHPSHDTRIRQLTEGIPQAMAVREVFACPPLVEAR